MTATFTGTPANAARTLEEYAKASMQRRTARLEKRAAEVTSTDFLDLAERLDSVMGEDAAELVDLLIAQRVRKQNGVTLSPEDAELEITDIAQLKAQIGADMAALIQTMVDAVVDVLGKQDAQGGAPAGEPVDSVTRSAGVPMIYCGVWREAEYSRGNTVTDKGSLWHCEVDKARDRPGNSGQWRLMHKSGK